MNNNLQKLNSNAKEFKNNEHYTPLWVKEKLEEQFGNIVYDPASTRVQANRLRIANYDDINSNGLTTNWLIYNYGNIFNNPPFTEKKEFIEKAVLAIKNGFKYKIFILVPDKSITNKYMSILKDISWGLIIPNGRINFINQNGEQTKGNFFGSVLLVLNGDNKITQW